MIDEETGFLDLTPKFLFGLYRIAAQNLKRFSILRI
jgi:hypothetical protein